MELTEIFTMKLFPKAPLLEILLKEIVVSKNWQLIPTMLENNINNFRNTLNIRPVYALAYFLVYLETENKMLQFKSLKDPALFQETLINELKQFWQNKISSFVKALKHEKTSATLYENNLKKDALIQHIHSDGSLDLDICNTFLNLKRNLKFDAFIRQINVFELINVEIPKLFSNRKSSSKINLDDLKNWFEIAERKLPPEPITKKPPVPSKKKRKETTEKNTDEQHPGRFITRKKSKTDFFEADTNKTLVTQTEYGSQNRSPTYN